ncbi:MAG: HPP family protein [Nanobdellota archaeon]
MNWRNFIKKERKIWHKHFVPSLFAALSAAFVAFLFQKTISGVILFASLGASAFILTNAERHRLTMLKTTIKAYIIAIIISIIIYPLNQIFKLTLSTEIFLLVFFVGISLYLANAVHPPAISGSLSFILFERSLIELFYLFLSIIVLLTLVRIMTYIFNRNFKIKEFFHEFKKD